MNIRKTVITLAALLALVAPIAAFADATAEEYAIYNRCRTSLATQDGETIVHRCSAAFDYLSDRVGSLPGESGERIRFMAASSLGDQALGEILTGDGDLAKTHLLFACEALTMVNINSNDSDLTAKARNMIKLLSKAYDNL